MTRTQGDLPHPKKPRHILEGFKNALVSVVIGSTVWVTYRCSVDYALAWLASERGEVLK
jgi:hypothetical protein